jgi:hypothetical protein
MDAFLFWHTRVCMYLVGAASKVRLAMQLIEIVGTFFTSSAFDGGASGSSGSS